MNYGVVVVVVVVVAAPSAALQLALPSAGCSCVAEAEHDVAPVPLQDAAPPEVVDDVAVSVGDVVPVLLPAPQADRPSSAVAAIARDAFVFMCGSIPR